jgi:hypothetical protein
MDEISSDFRGTLVELIDGSPLPADHPSPDRWIAYHRGELTPEEEVVLQEHLARCRDCFDLSAGAAEFARPDEEAEGVETAAVWRLVRPQPAPAPLPRRSPRSFLLPLAASFFVALIGVTTWDDLQQRSTVKALQAPQANVAILDFTGERAAGPEPSIPAGSPRLLVIHPNEDLLAYRLTIRDAATGRERSSHEMVPNQDLALTLYLHEGLPPGRYRLEIADGGGKVLETHTLRVTPGE